MNPERPRIAFADNPLHGDALSELLAKVDAAQANARPRPNGPTIRELVLQCGITKQRLFDGAEQLASQIYHAGQIALLTRALA